MAPARVGKMVYIFSGREFSQYKEHELKTRVLALKRIGTNPKIVAILVGEDPASKLYTSLKKQAAERIGIELQLIKLKDQSVPDLLQTIKVAGKDNTVHGIMVQLPLPGRLNSENVREKIFKAIPVSKDVDGIILRSPYNAAALNAVMYTILQAQEKGYLPENLQDTQICVVGAKGVVGRAIALTLEKMKLKIDKCDKDTKDLKSHTKKADLLISATGKQDLIKALMVKPGVVVIDIGAPKGDVALDVRDIAAFVTPVPGGIGPMTIACLLENTIVAAEKLSKRN